MKKKIFTAFSFYLNTNNDERAEELINKFVDILSDKKHPIMYSLGNISKRQVISSSVSNVLKDTNSSHPSQKYLPF